MTDSPLTQAPDATVEHAHDWSTTTEYIEGHIEYMDRCGCGAFRPTPAPDADLTAVHRRGGHAGATNPWCAVCNPHVDRADCWCQPVRDYKDPVTGTEVWVHREVVS